MLRAGRGVTQSPGSRMESVCGVKGRRDFQVDGPPLNAQYFKVFPGVAGTILWKRDDVHSVEGEVQRWESAGIYSWCYSECYGDESCPTAPIICPLCCCLSSPAPTVCVRARWCVCVSVYFWCFEELLLSPRCLTSSKFIYVLCEKSRCALKNNFSDYKTQSGNMQGIWKLGLCTDVMTWAIKPVWLFIYCFRIICRSLASRSTQRVMQGDAASAQI